MRDFIETTKDLTTIALLLIGGCAPVLLFGYFVVIGVITHLPQ
jgi:hypothetical protein